MNNLLLDLYAHQAWADAEHWNAFESFPAALDDEVIRKRLHHYHLTQHAFLSIIRRESLVIKHRRDFPTMSALKEYAKTFHDEAALFLQRVSDSELDETIVIPWFKDPPITITVTQALTQAAMHSHYHRGQNATRLRELGGQPPPTDFIVWYWKDRPEPQWT